MADLLMSDRWVLVWQRGADELGTPLVTGSDGMKVSMCLREAQPAVRTAPDPVGIVVVLPIALSETHRADLVASAFIERQEAAAGTAVRTVLGLLLDVDEGADLHGILPRLAADRDPLHAYCQPLSHQLGKLG